jgi:hypothetical protein
MGSARREPHDAYTVFSESDLLAGAEPGEVFAPPASGAAGGMRFGRVAGPALIAGVLAATVIMLLAHRPLRPPAERPATSVGLGSRAGRPHAQRGAPPSRMRVRGPGPGSPAGPSARRGTVAVARLSRAVGQRSDDPAPVSDEAAPGAIAPSETAEFGFER